MSSYRTIECQCEAEIIEKKSRFIAHLRHVDTEDEALEFLQEIRRVHAQARHNVYAYILTGGRARYSDDGEPAKTAGIPTYEVLMHADLVDVICVTTRYFGGTLLGTGGLVRAYTDACAKAVESAHIIMISRCVDVSMEIPYPLYQGILNTSQAVGAKVMSSDFAYNVKITFRLLEEDAGHFLELLEEITRGQASPSVSEPFDAAF